MEIEVHVHENVHVLCFNVNCKHESTQTCMLHINFPFSAYLTPPLHHNGKRSIDSLSL